MKFNKLFFAAVAFATLAMVSCKKDEPTPVIPTPDDEEVVPECPAIDAPGAGNTTIAIYAEVCPRGCYIVGNSTPAGWNEKDDQSLLTPVQGAENWYSVTIPFVDDLQIKAIARPSDEDVELGWSYQWGKNYDPNDPGNLDESVENTKILAGTGEFEYENQGQPKLIHVADNGVIYIWVKNWAASPIIEAKKLETAWVKSNFNNEDWAWYEMTPKGDGVFEFEGIWGGNGCNINETGVEDGAQWYASPELIDDPKAGDKVLVTFVSEKMVVGKLSIKLLEAGERPQFEVKDVTVTGIVPEGWTKCYIWAWGGEDDANYTGGQWPGEELTIDGGKVTKTFTQVKVPMKVIFSNGDGGQTKDITGITEDVEINIAENLK